MHSANFIAVDLGASAGRLMVGRWNGEVFSLHELHRFANAGVNLGGSLYWDCLGIWAHVEAGLSRYQSRFRNPPQGVSVDAWGVDFALLDRRGALVGNPHHYRDLRTSGMPSMVFNHVGERRLFTETGVQAMPMNTLFQLYSMVMAGDPQLELADTLLMIPDLYLYFLCGEKRTEYTQATTTQMYSPARRDWAREMIHSLGIPVGLLGSVVPSATIAGPVKQEVIERAGLGSNFPAIAVASHDTASAAAAIPLLDEHSAFISSGTWSLMGVRVAEPVTSEEALRLKFTNEGSADGGFLLLRNLTGLWILQECLRCWKAKGLRHTWEDVAFAAAGSRPLQHLLDPDADVFRMPLDMPQAIRAYCLSTHQAVPATMGEIARCAFESMCLKYRSVLLDLEKVTGRHIHCLRIVGGGSRNQFLCQMIADACNRTVACGPAEASALGNVMLQAVATGHLKDMQQGQKAIAASVVCTYIMPRATAIWNEADGRIKKIVSALAESSADYVPT